MAQNSNNDLPKPDEKGKTYPSNLVSQDVKKSKEWNAQFNKAFDFEYRNSGLRWFYNQRVEMLELLKMYQGLEDPDYYKEQTDYTQTQDGDKSFLNIDYQAINYGFRYINLLMGKLNKIDYSYNLDILNPLAKQDEIDWVSKIRTYNALKDVLDANGISGEQFTGEKVIPEDDAEIDYLQSTSKRSKVAIAKKLMIDHNLNRTNCKQNMHLCDFDTIMYGFGAMSIYLDGNGILNIENEDVYNLAVGYSNKEDASDIDRVGKYTFKTISEIRMLAPDLSEESLRQLADRFDNKYSNSYNLSGNSLNYTLTNYPYDNFRVPCFTSYCYSYDKEPIEVKQIPGNKIKTKKLSPTEYEEKGKADNVKIKGRINVYKCTRVIDQQFDICFDYGLCNNIARKYYWQKPPLPILITAPNIKKGQPISTFKQISPSLKKINVYGFKIQQMVAAAIPKGNFINQDVFAETIVQNNGIVSTPQEIWNLYRSTGTLLGSMFDSEGKPLGDVPFKEMENGLARDIMTYYNMIQAEKQTIQDILGENPATDSSTISPEMGLGVANVAIQNNNNALDYLFNSKQTLFSRLVSICSDYIDMMLVFAPKDMMVHAYGKRIVDELINSKQMGLSDWTIAVNVNPTKEDFAQLYSLIQGFSGKGLLDEEDMLIIYKMTDLNLLTEYVSNKIRINKKKAEKANQANIQSNAEMQQQSAKMAFDLGLQQMKMEYEEKAKLDFQNNEAKFKETEAKLMAKIAEVQMTIQASAEKEETKQNSDAINKLIQIITDKELQTQSENHQKELASKSKKDND